MTDNQVRRVEAWAGLATALAKVAASQHSNHSLLCGCSSCLTPALLAGAVAALLCLITM